MVHFIKQKKTYHLKIKFVSFNINITMRIPYSSLLIWLIIGYLTSHKITKNA